MLHWDYIGTDIAITLAALFCIGASIGAAATRRWT